MDIRQLYSNQYIPKEKLFSKEIDIEHIIPQARLLMIRCLIKHWNIGQSISRKEIRPPTIS